ncbi:hypothetical protein BD410DRAFT_617002 [Rickenella mellea]|uniref:Uncharacterized protein n=1 Tax=Rickenella mellea TaxID=50990 RepID=A0A4Y7PN56_9AGAM|nr:hypothetical protein BD410DRAFT_617002 [Rickenella mellea]
MNFAYYCSGHGYGHATRVSAFASHLLSISPKPVIYIVSSAPKRVFSDCIDRGAKYRFAEIDPVIVQPLAYFVDRERSVDVLREFLCTKNQKIDEEVHWLREASIDCVLSDAAFLACIAAKVANIPCALITNFTFDSVYSYLCTELTDVVSPILPSTSTMLPPSSSEFQAPIDTPLSPATVMPLVDQIHEGYRCADLLLRLPGFIPIPSFAVYPQLPSYDWINPATNTMHPSVLSLISENPNNTTLLPSISTLASSPDRTPKPKRQRKMIQALLLVRTPSPDIYTPTGRRRLLDSIGVPPSRQGPETKVLIVSFGGQIFRKPRSTNGSRAPSPSPSGRRTPATSSGASTPTAASSISVEPHLQTTCNAHHHGLADHRNGHFPANLRLDLPPRIATPSHLWIPGAPPANKPPTPALTPLSPGLVTVTPPTPYVDSDSNPADMSSPPGSITNGIGGGNGYLNGNEGESESLPQLLPDTSWIAIVCGVPKNWGTDDGEELPDGFFIAPRDVYMPDLTAVADVLLGKLGYGTVSECVDAQTPFIYVPRPLFIEEHGLRRLLATEGVGVELARRDYEAGNWAPSVSHAWKIGLNAKARRRNEGATTKRTEDGENMAKELIRWVKEWTDESPDSD